MPGLTSEPPGGESGLTLESNLFNAVHSKAGSSLGTEWWERNPMLQCCQFYPQRLLWCKNILVMLVILVTRWGKGRNGSVGSAWQLEHKKGFLQDTTCRRSWSLEPLVRSNDPQTCSTFDQTTVWSESCFPRPCTYTHQSSSTAKCLTRSTAASKLRPQFSYMSGPIVCELAESWEVRGGHCAYRGQ